MLESMSFLAYVGAVVLAWLAIHVLKLIVALICASDFGTATTSTLPKDAFGDGQVVWITGASSGIGRELALYLASTTTSQIRLVLSSRRKEALEKVADACRKAAATASTDAVVEVEIVTLDLASDLDTLAMKTKEALRKFGRIDLLINNGGVSTRVLAKDCTYQVDRYLSQVDYLAHVVITKTLLPTFETQSHARIVNIGSHCSRMGVPVRTPYCGAKHALSGFMSALRVETILTGHSHIYILNVCLGSTQTNLPGNAIVGMDEQGKPQLFQGADENIANGLDPRHVAERILAVAYAKKLDEIWLAKGKELLIFYLNQYVPSNASRLLVKAAGKQYAVGSESKKAKGD